MKKVRVKKGFIKEFKRQLRMAISAAVGFIIAFSWKDTIFRLLENQVKAFTTMTSAINVSIVSSLLTTFFGAVIIVISSKILKGK